MVISDNWLPYTLVIFISALIDFSFVSPRTKFCIHSIPLSHHSYIQQFSIVSICNLFRANFLSFSFLLSTKLPSIKCLLRPLILCKPVPSSLLATRGYFPHVSFSSLLQAENNWPSHKTWKLENPFMILLFVLEPPSELMVQLYWLPPYT